MLAAVTLVHMVAVAGALNAKPEAAVIDKLETPMMVSLVSQVADVPKEIAKPPVEQVQPIKKPVAQKTKSRREKTGSK